MRALTAPRRRYEWRVKFRSLLALAGVLVALAVVPAPASAQKPPNPCLDPAQRAQLRCPDLIMRRPFGLRIDPFVRPGRVMLRAGNSIDSVGAGPAELFGVRSLAHVHEGPPAHLPARHGPAAWA